MAIGRLFRAPHNLLLSFLALTLLPASALVWLGWDFVATDQERWVRERRELATELTKVAAAAIEHAMAADELRLRQPSAWPRLVADGAYVVAIDSKGIRTSPDTPLHYHPFLPELPEASPDLFASGEDDEYERQYTAAIQKFRELAQVPDAAVRAGALLRLARNLKKANATTEAIRAYGALAQERSVGLFGLPADLVGRHALCALLEQLDRVDELRRHASELAVDVRAGHWKLERGKYLQIAEDVARWLGTAGDTSDLAWTEVVEPLWDRWQSKRAQGDATVRELMPVASESYAILWRNSAPRLVALVASPEYVRKAWLANTDAILAAQGMRLVLKDSPSSTTEATTSPFASEAVVPGLPWTLVVGAIDGRKEAAEADSRRALLRTGLALLLVVVLAGSYFVARAMTRELALARLQSDFVAAVSHEFRTPLTSLGQATEILTDGRITDPERLAEYHRAQARATSRLRRLVDALLDFGRMEAGSKPYRLQNVEASELIQRVVDDFSTEPAARGYTIDLRLDGAQHVIHADPDALAHALRNLLDNAVKYSPGHPTVWVELSRTRNHVAIRVRDEGLGIHPREQKLIFQKFVRGSAAKAHGINGTGVGLAMVEHIVRAHGGLVQLESEPGKGSTFTILLRG